MTQAVTGFLALVAAFAAVMYGRALADRRRAERALEVARSELKALRSKAEIQEYRLERYDLVWYPAITYSPPDLAILSAAPGVPHCRACIVPLVLERGEWLCRQCAAKHPESLADLTVTDSIVNQALKWFQERHPGYRIPRK